MRFRIARIPVTVHPVFLVIAAVLALTRINQPALMITWVGVVFGSVLLHELGHALLFRAFGHAPSIELHGMGGHTAGSPGRHLSPGQDAIVSLAGPFFGFAIGGLALYLRSAVPELTANPMLAVVVADVVWVNIGWGVLNLLPILPLDGGRVLVAALRRVVPARASQLAYGISCAVAFLAAAIALIYGWLFAAILAGLFGASNFNQYRELRGY